MTPNRRAAAMPPRPAGEKPRQTMELASHVERWYLAQSGRQLFYPPLEKIPVIEVPNFPSLGRLTALRFVEWVLEHPEGVVSLPTGKTPEYFIRWTQQFLEMWTSRETQRQLAEIGLPAERKPDLRGLRFVQIDEFYPIEPTQHNSFHYYVNKYYIRGFGLDPEKALLIDPSRIGLDGETPLDSIFPDGKVDLTLRARNAASELERRQQRVIEAVDQFCTEYEERIRELGGLGFFVGGIGPDGHIGFNARGSHHQSPTRLTQTNYETEAAAAGDLGGIEISRNKPVITIGLGTITYNREAVVIIFAAGDAKARVAADAIQQERHVRYPATVLQGMPNARFYLTQGATLHLEERRFENILKAERIPDELLERAVIDRALALGKRLEELKPAMAKEDRLLSRVLERTGRKLDEAAAWTRERMLAKIERGLDDLSDQVILHTGPHHDDIMLGYMPYVWHLVRRVSNRNYFYVLTSGFTAVTNGFMAELLEELRGLLEADAFAADQAAGELDRENRMARAREIFHYLDGIAARDPRMCARAQARRTLVNLMSLYEDEDLDNIRQRIAENLNYLRTLYPGKKDIPIIQKLKGMQREFEEELIWAYVGTQPEQVNHARLGFYTGDIFTQQPTVERDVAPVLEHIRRVQPTIVSLAFDPEGSGPDTHYKVLQVLHEAMARYRDETQREPIVWGYRNVWYRFHPAEANVFIPATLNTMAIMEHSFMHCFGSQRNASFPSYEYDGPFCHQAQKLWVEQFRMVQTCLGERFFLENQSPRLRATRGYVFIKAMTMEEFSGKARRLAELTEGAVE
ncbi:MAG TPA: glucosamine-6-phosphate deaminase [Candidatus Sumerlaeota bacterium]|nr:glucosamine-6-phosphate deaminase [Candidatus Sumerlaeota bacterium]HPK02998.1 glucosamine-6-phosphate deaminase [Candidatus Sumerlaeota bacterium]